MNETQRIIKYLAMAFGIFLCITIISSILFGVLLVGSIFTGTSLFDSSKDLVEETMLITENIKNIDVKLEVSKLNIKEGTEFKIETKAKEDNYEIETNNGILKIKEKGESFFPIKNSEMTIYIPDNIEFQNVKIELGMGEANIEKLSTEESDINVGVGNTKIQELISRKNTKIEGGVGKLEIEGTFNNLDLDTGMGETIVRGTINGNSKVNSGIGKVELDLNGNDTWYSFETNVGIGEITLDGEKCENDRKYGNGNNIVKIDGGIGEVEITTK